MSETNSPVLTEPLPPQVVNEGAAFGPLNLNEFIQSPNAAGGVLRFSAQTAQGTALPKGLICTQNGTLSGIPASGTQGQYTFIITAENNTNIPLEAEIKFLIKERIAIEGDPFLSNLKSQVWQALEKNLPVPELAHLFNNELTAVEIYYLLQRFATLTVWDIYNLDTPGELKLLELEGANPHFNIYDRGSCLVGAPKDLYSHERTLQDALQTARVMVREVYKRGWTIEFAGFNKMVRAAWIELQLMGKQTGKFLEVLHYTPTVEDIKLYEVELQSRMSANKNL